MPRIPVYEQQLVPNASPGVGRMSPGVAGRGLQAVGEGLGQVATALEKRDQVDFTLEKDRIETEGKLWFASASSKADLDQAEYLKQLQEKAQPGAPGFTPTYLKQYDEYADGAVKNAPSQYARQLMQAHLARSREAYGKTALVFEAAERARFSGQQADDGTDISAKLIYGDPSRFDAEMGKWAMTIRDLPVTPEAKAKLNEVARKKLVNASVVSWIDRDPAAALTVLQDMGKNDGLGADVRWQQGGQTFNVPVKMGTLDEVLKWTAYADKKVTEQRQEASTALRYETANVEAMARTGVAPTGPSRTREEFLAAFKDPVVAEHEWSRYSTARQTATAVTTLQGRSTADLLAVIQQKPDARDPNFAVTSANQQVQAGAAVEIIKARNDDPVAYAIQTGDFQVKPLNPQDEAGFVEELKRRAAALPVMAEKYGKASMLAKPEAQMLAKQLEVLPADQKVARLETVRSALGDDALYASVLNAMRPDSPVTALVGNIAAVGSKETARLIARGEDLLNPTRGDKKADGTAGGARFPMPQEALMRQAWVDAVGEAYRGYPDAEATAYQAFKAYYAAAASDKGLNDPKASPDDRILQDAIRASTGGIMRWKTDLHLTGRATPSANIVLPYGMPEDVFRDVVSAEWLRVREAAGYPKTAVGDIGLYNTGANGEYMVMSGTSWMPGKDGKPIILRVPGPTQRKGQ